MQWEKRNFPYSSFILPTQWHEFVTLKLPHFHIFIIPLPLNVSPYLSPYLTTHIKINFETGCIGRFSEKT